MLRGNLISTKEKCLLYFCQEAGAQDDDALNTIRYPKMCEYCVNILYLRHFMSVYFYYPPWIATLGVQKIKKIKC